MRLLKWEQLPASMQTDAVRPYYDILKKKRAALFFKRVFDVFVSFVMLVLLSPVFLILAIAIKIDSRGPVFYRQVRVTQYGKTFRIFKFRSMVQNADKLGARYTLVVGDNELATGKAQLKDMVTGETQEVGLDDSLYTTLYNKALDRQLAGMADFFGGAEEE